MCLMLKDELLGLAGDPNGDPIFKNQHLDMDVLYRTGETLQVELFYLNSYKIRKILEFWSYSCNFNWFFFRGWGILICFYEQIWGCFFLFLWYNN